jgi:quinol monooxygenase YgiN
VLLVCHYRIAAGAVEAFTARARRAVELLTAQPGCRHATVARALDEADAWLLVVEFDSVTAYRRALSPFHVREHVVPLLSESHSESHSESNTAGTVEPSTFERILVASGGTVEQRDSLIAADAGEVRLGEAAGPAVPR